MAESKSAADESRFAHGGEFLKVALQLNPFAYLEKNGKAPGYDSEDDYNEAIVAALVDNDIAMVAVTDHFSIADSTNLLERVRNAGIVALPGFEAETSDGVHILCIFDEETSQDEIERCIGACLKPKAGVTFSALLDLVDEWGGLAVAAHVTTDKKGLLGHLKGRPRKEAWTHRKLVAASLSVAIDRVSDAHRQILDGTQSGFGREHPVAVFYAKDISSPKTVSHKTSWSWARMSSANLEGLRQAFLDPESRIRRPEEYDGKSNRHIRSLSWTGGFLDGVVLRLNPALNAVIGPRGAGKSTVLESVRFVLGLEAIGEEAQRAHSGFVERVLGPGAEVVVEVFDPLDSSVRSVVRSVGHASQVRVGETPTSQDPLDVAGPVQVLGQHEIAELAKDVTDRTPLLRPFIPPSAAPARGREKVASDLAENRRELSNILAKRRKLEGTFEEKADLEKRIDALKKAGIESTLDRESKLESEEPLFDKAEELLDQLDAEVNDLQPLDSEFLDEVELADLPSAAELRNVRKALEQVEGSRLKLVGNLDRAIADARVALKSAADARTKRAEDEKEEYLKKLRRLKQDSIDGTEFLVLVKKVAALEQDAKKLKPLDSRLTKLREQRTKLLGEWTALQQRDFDELVVATRVVNGRLSPDVRTTARQRAQTIPLQEFLAEKVGGQLDKVCERIERIDAIHPIEFAAALREGPEAFKEFLGWPGKQSDNVVDRLSETEIMELEELWLEPATSVQLNLAGGGEKPVWRGLAELSTGQKATAILLLVLLDSGGNAPLIIDQPEDDLDSDFIADSIVPQLRSEKGLRQFVLSTHNPNIPVLGDAEQVVRLTARGEAATGGRALIKPEHTGSMDVPSIRDAVAALEGGKRAFERRQRRYGY